MEVPGRTGARRERDDDVTASELAAFAYCAKAWHLERVLGASPAADAMARRDAGSIAHAQHGLRTSLQSVRPALGRWVIALLLVVGLLLIVLAFLFG